MTDTLENTENLEELQETQKTQEMPELTPPEPPVVSEDPVTEDPEFPEESQDPETPEEPEPEPDIPEPEPEPNPWDDAPTGVWFYDRQYDDGRLGNMTQSAERAYKRGWDIEHDYIAVEDVQQSDLNHGYYPKNRCPMKGLTEFKNDLLDRISAYADRFENNKCDEMYITSSLGFRANADRRSLQNVDNLIKIGQDTVFKDYDNQFHSVTVQDLETLSMEISINGSNLYNQKFQMQMTVMNFTTMEQIENFTIQFNMMDFSNGD